MSSAVSDTLLLVPAFEGVSQSCRLEEGKTPTEEREGQDQNMSVEITSPRWKPEESAEIIRQALAGEVKVEEEVKGMQLSVSRQPQPRSPLLSGQEQDQTVPAAGGSWRQPRPDNLLQPPFPARRRLRIYPAGNRGSKWVTREIAALEFLTGIRMRNEADIRAHGDVDVLPSSGFGPADDRWNSRDQRPFTGDRASLKVAGRNGRGVNPGGDGVLVGEYSGRAPSGAGSLAQEDDSDSDEGWLDQPSAGGGDGTDVGSSTRLTGASTRVNTANVAAAVAGRWVSSAGSPAAPARRLCGNEALHVRVPPTFRHHMHSLHGHGAAVVRQWEQKLTQQERLLEGRLFFSCSKGYPISVSSVIHYKPKEEEYRRMHQKRIDELGAEVFTIQKRDWRGHSYAHLLRPAQGNPTTSADYNLQYHHHHHHQHQHQHHHHYHSSIGGGSDIAPSGGRDHIEGEATGMVSVAVGGDGGSRGPIEAGEAPYVAGFLDDPALKVGRHRHVARGDRNTGPVVSSVLLFVKPRVLKDELNARFREEHPSLPPSLTLSKIRSMKRQALLGCHRAGMEVATVALACIYLERLCLAGWVTKPNRRLAMAACLAIAYKFNEPVLMEGASKLPALWAFVDQEWQVSKKRVLEAEFGVLVKLSFDLHEDPRDIFHHFALLLKMVDSNASVYLGEDMMKLYNESLETFREGGNDEGSGAPGASVGADGAAGSPRVRSGSSASTVGGDVRGGAIAVDSQLQETDGQGDSTGFQPPPQGFAFMETPGWLQRRPGSGSGPRWLAGWRGGIPEENIAGDSDSASSSLRTAPASVIGRRQTSGKTSNAAAVAGQGSNEEESKQERERAIITTTTRSSGGDGDGDVEVDGGSGGGDGDGRSGKSSTPSFLARVSSRRPRSSSRRKGSPPTEGRKEE